MDMCIAADSSANLIFSHGILAEVFCMLAVIVPLHTSCKYVCTFVGAVQSCMLLLNTDLPLICLLGLFVFLYIFAQVLMALSPEDTSVNATMERNHESHLKWRRVWLHPGLSPSWLVRAPLGAQGPCCARGPKTQNESVGFTSMLVWLRLVRGRSQKAFPE